MIYKLYVLDKRLKEYQAKDNYKTKKIAETKAKSLIKKGKEIKIISLPTKELKIGLKVYLSNGDLYGEIVDEMIAFGLSKEHLKMKVIEYFFLKDDFLEKYENVIFIMKEELDE